MKECFIALVDCDSFFVSCEQALNPDLLGKPVCVTSNNNGCIVARSREAKKLGIKMGMPYFMAKKEFPQGIYIPGNLQTYKDFSRKIMAILRDFSPTVQVYSIDEAFVELSGLKRLHKENYLGIAEQIRGKIKADVGVNVSIGVSKSKVLAKLACEKAKDEHTTGIYLIGQGKIPQVLKSTKVQEIWGIGRQTALLFNRWGILSCDELVKKSDEWLKSNAGKRGVELKHELLGECVDRVVSAKRIPKSIQNTRSFPKFTNDINYIKNALNIHIHNSCTKMRHFKGKCKTIGVMLRTKDFLVYSDKKNLESLTNFELEISRMALKLLDGIYNPDLIYRSCGVTLESINYEQGSQLNLFEEQKPKDFDKLAEAIDKLESKFGHNVVRTGFVDEEGETKSER